MGRLEGRVELDPGAVRGKPHPELDVLDRRLRKAPLVESAGRQESRAANRAQPCPERARTPGVLLVHVVVQQVAEGGDGAPVLRVVVGAEQCDKLGLALEGLPDSRERVRVNLHVGIDEHEHVASRLAGTRVPCAGRARGRRLADHDRLFGPIARGSDRREAARQRRGIVRGRNDRGERRTRARSLLACA